MLDSLGTFLQIVLEMAIRALVPVALGYAVIWLNARTAEAKAKMGASNFQLAADIVYQLVLAAEQSGLTGAIKNIGEEKKKYVIDLAEKELQNHGIKLDLDTLDALVEAAVQDAFSQVVLP